MPAKITFTGAMIRKIELKMDPATGRTVIALHMLASWTKVVREKMGWADLPELYDKHALEGKLAGISAAFEPTDSKLGKHRFEIAINSVEKFKAVRVKMNENSSRTELHFVIRTSEDDADSYAGAYMRCVGDSGSSVKVAYSRQMEFGSTEPGDDDGQQNLEV